jgi:isoleucyl-tRNA synthetase
MRGRRVERRFGWDCHGMPAEVEAEKQLGITTKAEIVALGIDKFNAATRESVLRYTEEWERYVTRQARWVDFTNDYKTLDLDYMESVMWAFKSLHDKGLIYEGFRVLAYCWRCETPLSNTETRMDDVYRDRQDPALTVWFTLLPKGKRKGAPRERIAVWTTTPWTLPSNLALAVGADIEYAVYEKAGEKVYVGAARADYYTKELADFERTGTVLGADLAGRRYEPLFDFLVERAGPNAYQVLPADFVTTEDGTGLVHTALAFGEDDFRLGEQYGMTLQNPVRLDGTYDERVPDFQGRLVRDHNPEIVAALDAAGRLFREVPYEHAYPHCWRCETPLIYYAKSSWYLRTSEVRDRMLAENERIGWHPEHIKHGRFGKWLEGNVDWALSRERYWGTPLPIWSCTAEDCDERLCIGSIAAITEHGGELPRSEAGEVDLHRPYIDGVTLDCPACGGEMERVPEVIDTWYDSGAMPFAQFHYPFENEELFERRFPADFISEAVDQTRGWFFTLHAIATLLFDDVAFRHCVVLGHINDESGR